MGKNTVLSRAKFAGAALAAVMASALMITSPAAARDNTAELSPYIIGDDIGGSLNNRILEINEMRASGRPVEIRGLVCISSCTMFLGVNDACVWPGTRFGFHGPSNKGKALNGNLQSYWINTMASFYQEPLKEWFLEKGSHKIKGVYWFTGAELIKKGVTRKCADRPIVEAGVR
jgi:hypothetical protein